YKHFVVVKGMTGDEVLIGDPALGLRFIPQERFSAMWENQILFIIRNRSEVGREHFNLDDEWKLLARAPLGDAVSRESLEAITIALPQLNDFS
ncbi:MAG: peptidase C39, partial [Gammaproteobacteria bacterium]|nr:peptidase C39 [Gammaproteobacteria bacterium]